MRRITVLLALTTALLTLFGGTASARGVWDPDDVRGPLDIRWVGLHYEGPDDAVLTLTFYPGFRVSALPKIRDMPNDNRTELFVQVDRSAYGDFVRRHGHFAFAYSDAQCSYVPRVETATRSILAAGPRVAPERSGSLRSGPATYGTATRETAMRCARVRERP